LRPYSYSEFAQLGCRAVYTDYTARQRHPFELRLNVVPLIVASMDSANESRDGGAKNANTNKKKNNEAKPNEKDKIKAIYEQMKLAAGAQRHPAFDIYYVEADVTFWKVIMDGPDSTPYAGGTWQLYIHFAGDYPNVAPVIRFVTPIKHCNVNSAGRICYSLLDKNWTSETTIVTILQGLYSLMLNPSQDDPLDSVLAQRFYEGEGRYEADILEHVKAHASKRNRKRWFETINEA